MNTLYVRIIIAVVLVAGIVSVSSWGYHVIYSRGYDAAEAHYKEQIKLYEDNIDKRIDKLEVYSSTLIEEYTQSKKETTKQFQSILKEAKNKETYVINNNVCEPSTDFMQSLNKAITEANKK